MESSVSASPYVLVPQRLCLDLRDNPTAIGVYALIARLFLVNHQAIPLSAGDIQRFDPQISYGQARRALKRLHTQGWVVQQALGRKNSYQPTWGHVKGQIHVWDATLAKLGRPAHVRNYRVAAAQLDQIAYLPPHTHLTAVIARGSDSTTLAQLGQQILHNAHLLPEPPTVVETAAVQEPLF